MFPTLPRYLRASTLSNPTYNQSPPLLLPIRPVTHSSAPALHAYSTCQVPATLPSPPPSLSLSLSREQNLYSPPPRPVA